MNVWVVAIFAAVYAGMIAGRLPWLALDRAGIALVGAIAVLATLRSSPAEAAGWLDVPTLSLLFGLMIVSAQFRLGGFYTWLTRKVATLRAGPQALLALVVATSGSLAALLTNDVIALAMAPVLVEIAAERRVNPLPLLIGLAAATNVGSAATLVGNPQNILIGETLGLSFTGYLRYALVPTVAGLFLVWLILSLLYRRRWRVAAPAPDYEAPKFDTFQTAKGIAVLTLIVAGFLMESWPRDLIALGGAAALLVNRRLPTRRYLAGVDWQLLVLFAGLFVVNHAFRETGVPASIASWLASAGADPHTPVWLFAYVTVLSNLVSNVPAVMLLLPFATEPIAGPGLALFSTLAGNFIIVSSIANIIVAEQAAKHNVILTWREHARAGLPITAATLVTASIWLWLLS